MHAGSHNISMIQVFHFHLGDRPPSLQYRKISGIWPPNELTQTGRAAKSDPRLTVGLGTGPDNISKQLCPPSWAIQPSESCSTASPGEFARLNVEYRKISGIL